MTIARKYQISLEDTPFYHIYNRCVRRAFLCGTDKYSGKCYEHRRQLIVDRIELLASAFHIDVSNYAIMSNHYHMILRVNSTKDWDEFQVLTAWSKLCKIDNYCDSFIKGEALNKAQLFWVKKKAAMYRRRLMDISWFMKLLNEHIARLANKEDEVTGTFFESRFKSQALLDAKALLTCMAYVDSNPIRAAMAATAETSNYTSVQQRIKNTSSFLLDFAAIDDFPDFNLADYCELVNTSGQAIATNKKAFVDNKMPAILVLLGTNDNIWLRDLRHFKSVGKKAYGASEILAQFMQTVKSKILHDTETCPA